MISGWQYQVADAVRSVKTVGEGGTCFDRVALGLMALRHLGLEPRPVMGSMIYRVGPDTIRDVVAFCGPGNVAMIPNLLHVWIELDGDIVDFAAGDWRQDASSIETFSASLHEAERGIGPIQWEIDPPRYVWAPAAPLKAAWRERGTPALGEMWYQEGVIAESVDHAVAYLKGGLRFSLETVSRVWPMVKRLIPPQGAVGAEFPGTHTRTQ